MVGYSIYVPVLRCWYPVHLKTTALGCRRGEIRHLDDSSNDTWYGTTGFWIHPRNTLFKVLYLEVIVFDCLISIAVSRLKMYV